jgi:peptidoglycan/xylan/chitin deacetylase (PgdA/CDA1 family)
LADDEGLMSGTVLAYHAVADQRPVNDPHQLVIAADDFAAQMDELARSRLVVPLDELVKRPGRNGRPVVAITFDDGYRGVFDVAAPILAAHGFSATVFVPTGHIGDRNRWDDLADTPFQVLDDEQLLELDRTGVTIESHGHRHISYARSPLADIADDVRRSTEVLEDLLGRRPRYLAYPWGPSSLEARKLVADEGYDAAFSINQRHAGRFAWGRVPVQPTDSLRLFRFKTSGYYQSLRQNSAAGWLSSATRPLRHRLRATAARTD